jgi:arginyl-tRNA--protein-N-Asp/Glu arginylyltransferase
LQQGAAELSLVQSEAYPCPYLPGRQATVVFADPEQPLDAGLYGRLCALGFRRSHDLVYRPRCQGCSECIAVRVPVARFRPRRSQRRCLKANADLVVRPGPARLTGDDAGLLDRYLSTRHPAGGMDHLERGQLAEFLESSWCPGTFVRFFLRERLAAVMVLDVLSDGLSAVFHFFDPELSRRSPGVFAILWSIDYARRLGLDWLYLGYWIRDCPKMSYKAEYLPQQRLAGGRWREYP